MKKQLKPIPEFKTEDEEREFWSTHSSVDYVDWSGAYRPTEPFPNLKSSEDLIELKLPLEEIRKLDALAKKRNVTRDVLAQQLLHAAIQQVPGQAHI